LSDYVLRKKAHNINFLRGMLLNSTPEGLETIGRKKLIACFKRAVKYVPHYANFLEKKKNQA